MSTISRFYKSACVRFVQLRWKLFNFYYDRLLVQAGFLYRQSSLYHERWQEIGLDFAEDAFTTDYHYFFKKAQEEPFLLRLRLFIDGLIGAPRRPYYID